MYYVVSAPCQLCSCCKEATRALCTCCTNMCGETCKAIRDVWSPITANPLASFVLGTWAIHSIVICACIYAITGLNTECADDDKKSILMVFCAVQVLCSLVHMCFAFYIQRRLVRKIDDPPEGVEPSLSGLVWYLLKYDVGFCLYFFFAAAAPAYALYNSSVINDCNAGDSNAAQAGTMGAIFLAVAFVVLEFFYMCCFVCGAGAKDTLKSTKKGGGGSDPEPTAADPEPTVADASAA